MSSDPRSSLGRIVGAAWLLVSLAALGTALSQQPVSEWGFLNLFTGTALVILAVIGLFYLVSGRPYMKPNTSGFHNPRRTVIWTWVAVGLIALAAALNFVADGAVGISAGDATGDILMLGVWLDLIIMLLANIRGASLQMAGRW